MTDVVPKELTISRLTWEEIRDLIKSGYNGIILPLGSTEQHGPHMPLEVDTVIAQSISLAVAKRLGGFLVCNALPFGVCPYHMDFPGSISISPPIYESFIFEIANSLVRHGFLKIIILSGHGGNFKHVINVISKLKELNPRIYASTFPDFHEFSKTIASAAFDNGIDENTVGAHSGVGETSLFLFLDEKSVRKEKLTRGYVGSVEQARRIMTSDGTSKVSNIGVLGDPTKSDIVYGRIGFERVVEILSRYFLDEMKQAGFEVSK